MSDAKNTQYKQIIDHLNKFGSITPMDAFHHYGITKLATRISEMRSKKGMRFHIEMETGENRFGKKVRYARYSWGGE